MQFDRTALILGLMIFYVAHQQWQTNERKRKQDLFGKDIQEHIINLFEQKINTYDEFTKPFEKYLCLKSVSKNLIIIRRMFRCRINILKLGKKKL